MEKERKKTIKYELNIENKKLPSIKNLTNSKKQFKSWIKMWTDQADNIIIELGMIFQK